tara:strand:- start:321 stop:644 length:324 start_codon:yes stop_codon:yes gene_type:complete
MEVKKMNTSELEVQLLGQVESGILTEFEMKRIMTRATGGVYLTPEQREQYDIAKAYINSTVSTLFSLRVISEKRVETTRRKLELALSKHIANGGALNENGSPVLEVE